MSLSRVVIWAILAAAILVGTDVLFQGYVDLRTKMAVQTATVNNAVAQINEIANSTFTRSLAELYYSQARVDVFTEQVLGSKAAKTFKQNEDTYIQSCSPQFGELQCRREWMKAHVQQLFKIIDGKKSQPRLTPV